MQQFPPSSNSSRYPPGHLNHSVGERYHRNTSLFGERSTSNSGIFDRTRAPSVQDTFSLATATSSMYRAPAHATVNPNESTSSRLMGPAGNENQIGFMPNHRTQYIPSIPVPFPTSPQPAFNGNIPQNVSQRELGNPHHCEHTSASLSPPRRNPKLYTCEICQKKFVRPSSLTTHRFSHTGEKPHSCPTCGKPFSVASNLRRHEMTIHGPRASGAGNASYDGMNQTTSGGLQSASLVGCTSSSVIYQRGSETYENILPSHQIFQDIHRGRRM